MQNGCPSGARLESPEVLYERQHGLGAFWIEGDAKAVAAVSPGKEASYNTHHLLDVEPGRSPASH